MQRTVLIVDDNDINRETLVNIFSEEYAILEAADGKQALKILNKNSEIISAVLLDLIMPVLDGFEVIKAVRASKELEQIPIIVTTGDTTNNIEIKALSLGANDFAFKPYQADILKQRVWNVINLRETAAIVNSIRTDALTGLPTRISFFEQVSEMIPTRPAGYYVMVCFDIDRFKIINDQYGTTIGDKVLKHIATVLQKELAPIEGICCRIMADTFAVMYPAGCLQTDIPDRIRAEATSGSATLPSTILCIGRYIIDDPSLDPSAMYDRASMAKESIKDKFDIQVATYDESMRKRLLKEQRIIGQMRNALKTNQFNIWFQPQYNHSTGACIGAEALSRWNHPSKGTLLPEVFIPVFERNGFIYELDKAVWEKVCSYLRKWLDEGKSPLPISINISRFDLLREDFIEVLTELIKKYRIPRTLLRLDITETAFASTSLTLVKVVQQLSNLGFSIAIDDFGSGYSSLHTLTDVPANIIKLDMDFLDDSGNKNRSGSILESIVRMIKWLDMTIIAKCVETVDQANFLQSIGCNYVQGSLYSMPLPVDEYEKLDSSIYKEKKLRTIGDVKNLINNNFWDSSSMDTLLFNNYVGSACVFEYKEGNIELLRVNERYLQLFGEKHFTIQDLLKLKWTDYLDARDKCILADAIKQSASTTKEIIGEYIFKNLPGCPPKIYLRTVLRVIATVGNSHLVYCFNENITEQKEAERKEKSTAARFQAILTNINSGIIATSLEDDDIKLLFANNQYYELLGYTQEEFEKNQINALAHIHPDDREAVLIKRRESFKNKKPFNISYRIIRKNGVTRWWQNFTSISNFPDIDGGVQLSVINDITKTVNNELKTRQLDNQLHSIVDNIVSGISATINRGDKTDYLFVNKSYYDIVGYTSIQYVEEVKNYFSIVNPDDVSRVRSTIKETYRTGNPSVIEYRLRRRDTQEIWIRNSLSITQFEGTEEPVLLSIFNDITSERHTLESNRLHDEEMKIAMAQMGKIIGEFNPTTLTLTLPDSYAQLYGIPTTLYDIPYSLQDLDILSNTTRKFLTSFYNSIINGEKKKSVSIQTRQLDNSIHWELYDFISLFGDNGIPVKAIISINDITEQIHTRKLYEQETQLRRKLIDDCILYYQLNLSQMILEEFISRYNDLPSMIPGTPLSTQMRSQILNNVDPTYHDLVLTNLFSSALLEQYHRGELSSVIEYKRNIPDQGLCWVRATINIMERPDSNEIIAFLYIRNIDIEKKNTLALETIIDEEIEIVCLLSIRCSKLRCIKMNIEGSPLIKEEIDYEQSIPDLVSQRIIPEDRFALSKFLIKKDLIGKLNKKPLASCTYRKQLSTGHIVRKRLLAFYLDDSHEDIVFSVRDITDLYEEEQSQKKILQKAVDDANEANHAKSDFLSRMSHDMRTPLNAVLAFSGSEMNEGATEDHLRENIEKIHASGEYLLGIINDVLDMAKIEQKKIVLMPEPYSLKEFTQSITTVIGELSKNKHINFTLDTSETSLLGVRVDKIRFNQIFMNLLSNAVKFTPDGGKVSLIIQDVNDNQTTRTPLPNETGSLSWKRFIVSDNGIGMSEEFIPHAFESFSQEYRKDVSEKNQGTGLGLSIVKEIINMMGGTIQLHSELNKGTIYIIEIPFETVSVNEPEQIEGKPTYAELNGLNILLCEDNEMNTEIARTLLEKHGCIVDCAANGQLCLQKFNSSTEGFYDLILMDIRMPVMNGIEAAKAIRVLKRKDAIRIPIIAMTADAFTEDEQNSRDAGMNGHISKPINPDVLYTVIIKNIKVEDKKTKNVKKK